MLAEEASRSSTVLLPPLFNVYNINEKIHRLASSKPVNKSREPEILRSNVPVVCVLAGALLEVAWKRRA
jgi:hypothetical protein